MDAITVEATAEPSAEPADPTAADATPSSAARTSTTPALDVEFEKLYRANRDDVYAYVATLVRDRATAEDVTSTAFERAYRKRASFDRRRGEARGWLFGIARNAALDELRKRKRRAWLAAEPADPDASVDSVAEESERRLALRQALATLSGPDRELIALRFFAGLSMAEIGTTLGISESNAGTRTHRALTRLRRAYDGTE